MGGGALPHAGGGEARVGAGESSVGTECVGVLPRRLDRAEGLGKNPVQRPSYVDMSGPVFRRLWDFQRDEQPGDEVNKMGAGFCTGAVLRVRGQAPSAALSSRFNLAFPHVPAFGPMVCACLCGWQSC